MPTRPVFKKILVPLDGSDLAAKVVRPLERLLHRAAAELTLLRVVEPRTAVDHDRLPAVELEMQDTLRTVREAVGPEVQVRLALVRGEPAAEIVRWAQDTGADLVAMSTHGRTGLDRLVRGSVAEQVLRTCDAPLLLCSPHAFAEGAEPRFQHILVALDGSPRAERILPAVERVAAAHDSTIKLLRVEPMIVSEVPSPILTGSLWDPRPLEQTLAPAVDRLELAGLRADACAAYGDVATELLRAAKDADLLAMTTHGRSGVSRLWSGSVAEKVLREARCPLLVLRTPSD